MVEVDASTTGMGAVLSQHNGETPRLPPCVYFSRKLTSAEQNYDIGNRELLAIKLALEEWRHWLEGAQHPFMVITDHKNLEYIRSAKRLNPRQVRWALFFTRFQFTITYRPGGKNIKADSLSRILSPDEPLRLNRSSLQLSSSAPFSGIWRIRSVLPLSQSLLCREAQKGSPQGGWYIRFPFWASRLITRFPGLWTSRQPA